MAMIPLERAALKALMRLPAPLLHRFAAGLEDLSRSHLDARVRVLLALSAAKPSLNSGTVAQGRATYRDMIDLLDFPRERVSSVTDHHINTDDGHTLLLRSYHPASTNSDSAALPAIAFFHGGGFTVGSVEIYDRLCRHLANRTQAVVISTDYRLAPEHPAPTGAEDCVSAWRWITDNTAQLGIDAQRIAVMGDSAGGCMSAVVCQQAQARDLPLPARQVLVYPTTDAGLRFPSSRQLGQGFGLDLPLLTWFRKQFVPHPDLLEDVRVSPLRQTSFSQLPSAIVVTCTDPLRDEGLAYASALRDAGVSVTSLDYPALVHGFMTMGGIIPAAATAVNAICDTLRQQL